MQQEQTPKVGQQLKKDMQGGSIQCQITAIEPVTMKEQKGQLITYDFEGYGETQPFFKPDNGILDSEAQRRQSRSRMPLKYVYKRANDFDWTLYGDSDTSQLKRIVNLFVVRFTEWEKAGKGLYITSKCCGSGKTMLACCIANELIKRVGLSVKFVTSQEYVELMRKNDDDSKEQIKSMKDCSLLIFDDIGAEASGKDWTQSVIFGLVNYRHERFLPTIYTSNFDYDDLKEDARTIDRIRSHTAPIYMPNVSVRRKIADKENKDFINSLSKADEKIF